MLPSTVATHERLPEIQAALAAKVPLRRIAADFGVSTAALVRHKRAQAPKPNPALVRPEAVTDQDQREAELLVRAARRHLKQALTTAEDKDRNGAITAAIKALEHRAKLRGKLQSGNRIDIHQTQVNASAVELHSRLSALAPNDLLSQAGSCLADGLMRSDALALRILADLNRLRERQSVATVAE